MNVIDAIREGRYSNRLSYGGPREAVDKDNLTGREVREQKEAAAQRKRDIRAAYHAEQSRLDALFRADLEAAHGLVGHPMAARLWELAWEHGHSSGLEAVAYHYDDLAELLA